MLGQTYNNFKTDYPAFKNIIQQEKIDLLVCDFGSSVGCIEAANQTNVPYISTMAFAMTKGNPLFFFFLLAFSLAIFY
jgi:hypothetical protein